VTAASQAPAPADSDVAAPAPPPEPAQSPEKRLDRFLADLCASDRDWSKCFQALQGLSMMPVIDNRRDEVAEVLNTYLKEQNYSARSSALRAASTWGTKGNASAIAELIKNPTDRARAARALRTLGPAAETAVIALLAEADVEVRVEACKLLSEIGGRESLAAVRQQLSKDAAEEFKTAAKGAIEKLQAKQ
jgi:HEAT repeat protein